MKSERLWSPVFALAWAASALVGFANYMLVAVLPSVVVDLGGSKPQAGMVVGLFSLAALATRPVWGWFLDHWGRKPVLILGSILFVVGTVFQALWPSLALILVFRVIQGLGFSAVSMGASVVLTDVSPAGRLAEGLGWLQIAIGLNFALGPTLGLALENSGGLPVFYVGTFVLLGLALVASVLIRPPRPVRAASEIPEDDSTSAEPLPAGTILLALVSFFTMLSMGCVQSFLPLYGRSLGITGIGFFFPVYAISSIVGIRWLAVWLPPRWGRNRTLLVCQLAAALAMVGLFFVPPLPVLLLVAVIYGLGFGSSQTLILAALMAPVPPHRRGTANGLNYAALDVGMTVGPIGAGFIAQVAPLPWIYAVAALGPLAALILSRVLMARNILAKD